MYVYIHIYIYTYIHNIHTYSVAMNKTNLPDFFPPADQVFKSEFRSRVQGVGRRA